jgi:SAM-dependent methyltransferase
MLLERIHQLYHNTRRTRVLSRHLAAVIPDLARVLDVGAGDGLLAQAVQQHRNDIEIDGIDVLVRPHTHTPVHWFDGKTIPHGDHSFDVVMFVDVIHHADDPVALLREAVRVARKALVIKDHTLTGFLADSTLRFMDRVGNARHGVALPFNYWTERQWSQTIESLGLKTAVWNRQVGLYPRPARWVFDRRLHFVARLEQPLAPR